MAGTPDLGNEPVVARQVRGRRHFLELSLLTGTAAVAWSLREAAADDDAAASPAPSPSALPAEPLPTTLLFPERTGRLPPERATALGVIFDDVGRRWRNAAFNRIDRAQLLSIVALKTGRTPSYLSEYLLATQTYLDWAARHGPARALDLLFAIPADAALTTVAGHVRTYTLFELLKLQVSQGTFRSLGYVNFPGFAGGRYNDPARLPYRRA